MKEGLENFNDNKVKVLNEWFQPKMYTSLSLYDM